MYSPTKLQYTRNVNLNNVLLNLITEVVPLSAVYGHGQTKIACAMLPRRRPARWSFIKIQYNNEHSDHIDRSITIKLTGG